MPPPDPEDELAALREVSTRKLAETIRAYERALVGQAMGAVRATEAEIEALILRTVQLSRTLGRLNILAQYDAATGAKNSPAAKILETTRTPFRSDVSFDRLLMDFASREPRLAIGYEAVREKYAEEHAVAFARAATLEVTRTTQDRMARAFATTEGLVSTSEAIAQANDWTLAYSDTVYRTCLSSSFNAGLMAETRDPDVSDVFPAVEYMAVRDSATRQNHAHAHGLIAGTHDPIWQKFTPPMGYQCRCSLSPVSVFDLRERGLMRDGQVIRYEPPGFASAGPDPGFGTALRV